MVQKGRVVENQGLVQKQNKNAFRLIFLFVSLIFVGIVVYLGIIKASQSGKQPVEFIIAPTGASLKINGRGSSGGIVYMDTGTYTVSVDKKGFQPVEQEVEIKTSDNQPVVIGLNPLSEEAWEERRTDPAYMRVEFASAEQATQEGEDFYNNNPLAKKLPYRGPIYNIDYRLDDSGQGIVVQITLLDPSAKKAALSQLTYWGYNTNELTIEYLDPPE